MSLYSYSTNSSRTSDCHYLASSSSSSLTSITTISDHRSTTTDEECRIEKNISLKDHLPTGNSRCVLRATMTKDQIIVSDSLSNRSTIIPGKHVSMKVVFKY